MILKGYSGCRINVICVDGINRVIKQSNHIDYNERLMKQMKKQQKQELRSFVNCQVYDHGFSNGLFFYTMEYINGCTLADYMKSVPLEELDSMVCVMTSYYTELTAECVETNVKFVSKIDNTYEAICQTDILKQCLETIDHFVQILKACSWNRVISSPCHGDMTMENIMVQDKQLFLIDFLDSFFDSWMIDAAKLLQDADIMWSFRKHPMDSNLVIRLTVFRDLLIQRIMHMKNGEECVGTVYQILLLNLLRILPYTKNKEDMNFLLGAMERIEYKLKQRRWLE